MSRHIETGADEHGRYYLETLDNENACRWLIDDVCCNADCDMCCDFPYEEDCTPGACGQFEAEPKEGLEELRKGVKSRA